MGLPYVLREVIPIMELLKDIKKTGFLIESTMPKVTCKFFEGKSGALDMVKVSIHIDMTKHLNVKTHHFRDYVTHCEVTIVIMGTLD